MITACLVFDLISSRIRLRGECIVRFQPNLQRHCPSNLLIFNLPARVKFLSSCVASDLQCTLRYRARASADTHTHKKRNESVPKNKFTFITAISILVISRHDSFRVLFDKIV